MLFNDAAEFFRELMPGTWVSAAMLLFIAAIAWSAHQELPAERRRRLGSFWSLAAIFFVVFAIDELTQAMIFLSQLVEELGAVAPAGFHDIEAFLLSALFLIAALVLLPYTGDILRHPVAAVVLVPGVILGIASQMLDSVATPGTAEFVAEECLKLGAEIFLIGGFLVALREIRSSPSMQAVRGRAVTTS